MTIRTEAQGYLEQGASVDLLREIITRAMEQQQQSGRQPPMSLRAYRRSLPDLIAAHRAASQPPDIPDFLDRLANGNGTTQAHAGGFKSRATVEEEKRAAIRKLAEQPEEGLEP